MNTDEINDVLGLDFVASKILTIAGLTLEIDPDDVESVDWTLSVNPIEEDGVRKAGQRNLTLDIKFKEKGAQWVENK